MPARAWPQQVWSVVELGSHVLGKAQPHHLSTYGPRSRPDHLLPASQRSLTLAGTRWNSLSAPWPSSGPASVCVCPSLPWSEVTRGEQGRARLFSIGHLPALTGLTGSSCPPDAVTSRTAGERRRPERHDHECDWLQAPGCRLRGLLTWLSADSFFSACRKSSSLQRIERSTVLGTPIHSSTSLPYATVCWRCARCRCPC